ncbi:MAG TPA: hypothetical protein VGZ73_11260 [Bryobacteraceae bacterium]|jgi:hypothetical protein|nr:hypothetical protein [Bryobacteraceae bacterium]
MNRNERKQALRNIGRRRDVIQIVPPRNVVRQAYLRKEDSGDHELVTRPLASPTGPGGAAGFTNRANSQIAVPEVTNIYMGPFWGDQAFVEGFSKAILENGYLDPLKELKYRTGPGKYLGKIDGPALDPGSDFADSDAQAALQSMLDQGIIQANANSLFILILPDGVTSLLDTDQSCQSFCGYHEAFSRNGLDVAYAVMPSSLCQGCGGQIGDFTAVYAHELAEAATDKVPGQGWRADDGSENGDLEAWILFGWGPPNDPERYTVQGYYTNERGNTVGTWHA